MGQRRLKWLPGTFLRIIGGQPGIDIECQSAFKQCGLAAYAHVHSVGFGHCSPGASTRFEMLKKTFNKRLCRAQADMTGLIELTMSDSGTAYGPWHVKKDP